MISGFLKCAAEPSHQVAPVTNEVLIVMRQVDSDEILSRLKSMSNAENVAGMAHFGINPKNTYGISIPDLRRIAKELGKNRAYLRFSCGDLESTRHAYLHP